MERTGSSALSLGEGPEWLRLGIMQGWRQKTRGPWTVLSGQLQEKRLKHVAPAQHGTMDGGIRLTEAAQGFLFAGPAEGGGGT